MCRRSRPARARVFATGQGRKTDATDADPVAVVALRTQGLQVVAADGATVALRLLADRRDGVGHARTDTVSRLHRLLLELLPGGVPSSRLVTFRDLPCIEEEAKVPCLAGGWRSLAGCIAR